MNEDRTSIALTLAKALADRIAEVVPDGVDISVHETSISVQVGNAEESIDIEPIIDQEGDPEGNIEAAALMVLNDVQDLLTENTATPWPPVAGADGRVLPYPHAEVVRDELQLFFGAPESPALALRPIRLEGSRDE